MRLHSNRRMLTLGCIFVLLVMLIYKVHVSVSDGLKQKNNRYFINESEIQDFKIRTSNQDVETTKKISTEQNTFGNAEKSSESTNWTILLTVNNGFFDFFQNWFWFYKKLDLHLPITLIAEDEIVYDRLKSACSYCSVVRGDLNISMASRYKEWDYKNIVSKRPWYILDMLSKGQNVLYSDIDTVWLHNPLTYFNDSVDCIFQEEIKRDNDSIVCTGFMAFKSNLESQNLMLEWHNKMSAHPGKNQPPFNKVFNNEKRFLKYQMLSTEYFPSGRQYFKEFDYNERSKVVVVHNNFIVGHDEKRERFKQFQLWAI